MNESIGSKYEETKAMLREGIRDGTINALEAEADNHVCYFCGKHIEGKMRVLTTSSSLRGREAEAKYFIDNSCHQNSKLVVYHHGVPFSLN